MSEREQIKMRLHYLSIWQMIFILFFAQNTFASLAVDEFNDVNHGWTIYPANIGRTSTPGWSVVSNDNEQAIALQPTTSTVAYYWRLTKTIDLGNLGSPQLEIKYLLPGLGYDQFKISVAPANARLQSDFVPIYQQAQPSNTPQTITLDLSAYQRQEVQIQFSIRKPTSATINQNIGLYIHKVALKSPPAGDALVDRAGEIRIASFNVQVFGLTKVSDPLVLGYLTDIFSRFDVIFMQEIRDKSGTAIMTLLNKLNERANYQMVISERLGRTASKEQYAYIYRADKLSVDQARVVGTQVDFERPPYLARFSSLTGNLKFWMLGIHDDPDHVLLELNNLSTVINNLPSRASDEAMLIVGDMNADCDYLKPAERAMATLFQDNRFTLQVGDQVDTTTSPTDCTYDRIFSDSLIDTFFMDTGILLFDQSLGLIPTVTKKISDHYPVWIRLYHSSN